MLHSNTALARLDGSHAVIFCRAVLSGIAEELPLPAPAGIAGATTAHADGLCDTRRDTAGQERYRSLAPLYYRGAAAAAVVYDITSSETFVKAKYWVSELQKNASGNIGALRGLESA